MIIFPDEGVNHQELFERVVDQFEGAVDLPSLCLAQVEKLVIGSKYDVAAAVDAEICFHKGIGQMVFLQAEVKFSWLFRPKVLAKSVGLSCYELWFRKGWTRCVGQFFKKHLKHKKIFINPHHKL